MTTAHPATDTALNSRRTAPDLAEDGKPPPRMLAFLCVLIIILPSYSVLPGPLKSNGSPAKIIAIILLGLAVLGFVLIRRTAATQSLRPGVIVILVFGFLQLATY